MVSTEPRTGSPAAKTAIRTGASTAARIASIDALSPMSAGQERIRGSVAASSARASALRHRDHLEVGARSRRTTAPPIVPVAPTTTARRGLRRTPRPAVVGAHASSAARCSAASRRASTSAPRATSAGHAADAPGVRRELGDVGADALDGGVEDLGDQVRDAFVQLPDHLRRAAFHDVDAHERHGGLLDGQIRPRCPGPRRKQRSGRRSEAVRPRGPRPRRPRCSPACRRRRRPRPAARRGPRSPGRRPGGPASGCR